ncbi:MAG: MMPL family transporter, partial [Bacteroidota bacterium]
DPALDFYLEHYQDFGSDEDVLLVAVKSENGILEKSFLQKLETLRKDLRKIENIKNVEAITSAKNIRKTPFGLTSKPLLDLNNINRAKDSVRLLQEPLIPNLLVSNDLQTAILLIELESLVPEAEDPILIEAVENACSIFPKERFHIGGDTNTQVKYISMLEAENIRLIPISIAVIVLILILLYRSFWSVLIPTVSVIIGLVFLYGYAAAIGRHINISTLMFPTVMAVVGMSDLIHLYNRYLDKLRAGLPQNQAILKALYEVRKSLLLTSITTVIGFLTLSRSSIPHVASFGFDAAIGVVMAFLIAITLTPVVLSFIKIPRKVYDKKSSNEFWQKLLDDIFNFSKNKTKSTFVITLLFLLVGAWGIMNVSTNNFLFESISEDSKLRQDYQFFEKTFAGIRSYELAIRTKQGAKISDLSILREIEKVENYLQSKGQFGTILSPVTLYKSAQRIQKSGQLKYYQLPDKQSVIPQLQRVLKDAPTNQLINEDETKARLTTRMKDLGRLGVLALNEDLQQYIDANVDTTKISFTPTGKELLIDRNNDHLISEMLSSIAIAFLLISIIMAYLFRDFKMVLISLIPNIIPLIMTAGMMGIFGVPLNGSSAIIFIISFVIAVDDTIHFLSKFRLEKLKGKTTDEAIYSTFHSTGKAIIITSIILAAGYGVTLFSDFTEAYYHGVLICWTLIFAVLADLFVLPILLRKFLR